MDSASTIGIVYCGDNPDDMEFIKNYIQTLRNLGKQVKSLGFIHVKELPLGLNGSMMHQYYALKELNWYFKPSSQFIDNFVNEEFDVLFDFGLPGTTAHSIYQFNVKSQMQSRQIYGKICRPLRCNDRSR